jgi:hypothetical protein
LSELIPKHAKVLEESIWLVVVTSLGLTISSIWLSDHDAHLLEKLDKFDVIVKLFNRASFIRMTIVFGKGLLVLLSGVLVS